MRKSLKKRTATIFGKLQKWKWDHMMENSKVFTPSTAHIFHHIITLEDTSAMRACKQKMGIHLREITLTGQNFSVFDKKNKKIAVFIDKLMQKT
ncbi:hypothetical protein [Cellvibrio japonicus]|nr:hypothetical protein [Cellvibrio japonicus]QEI11552.1 hypothetical protein FY117_04470 [Cellvibrio japonicus]QEI15126.1 hypothetical protein FY116_04470 [Cellvibrio japonicus]QEI18706.1 hypothetical protein FY115_04470 [Cellvibrio japonicus]